MNSKQPPAIWTVALVGEPKFSVGSYAIASPSLRTVALIDEHVARDRRVRRVGHGQHEIGRRARALGRRRAERQQRREQRQQGGHRWPVAARVTD